MILMNTDAISFLQTLEDDSVDLILTDPPYVISKPSGMQQAKDNGSDVKQAITTDFGDWDKNFTMEELSKIIDLCYQKLKPSGTAIFWFDVWKITTLKEMMEESNFKQIRLIEWLKTNPVPVNSKINYLTNAREIALTGVKGSKPVFNSEYDDGVYEYAIFQPKSYKRFHPTQKSIPLFEELIRKHSNDGDFVVDCFSGSGTTAIAAILQNRRFAGCELDKDFYDKSLDYISFMTREKTEETNIECFFGS
jgi:DNA modification methylase